MLVLIWNKDFFLILILNYLVLAKSLFQAVDQNHNGSLDFTDLMALTTIINKLHSQYGGVSQ